MTESMLAEAIEHRAINHPYLIALRDGEFNNITEIFKDFAQQYGAYSDWFPRYLTAVISKLECPEHRSHLLENLSEESGHLHDEDIEAIKEIGIEESWVQGVSHPNLFKRFQNAMGVTDTSNYGTEVEIWRESFLSLVKDGSDAAAIGAIGLGTESIVKHVYKHIIQGLQDHTDLSMEEYVFFPLHTEVDDEHGIILINIAEEIGKSDLKNASELRKGMLKALNLRASFWDDMYERAKRIDQQFTLAEAI